MIFINFKTYPAASYAHAVSLANLCYSVARQTDISITPIVQAIDLSSVTEETQTKPWLQHLDPYEPGSHTGFVPVEQATEYGAVGTLLNHSEHQIPFDQLVKTVERIREIRPQFHLMICVPDMKQLEKALMLHPDYIAYEPPELIGSMTGSVASEKSNIIAEAAKEVGDIPLIVGAGVKSAEDVTVSLEKGASGILVASAVVKAENQEQKLVELAKAFVPS